MRCNKIQLLNDPSQREDSSCRELLSNRLAEPNQLWFLLGWLKTLRLDPRERLAGESRILTDNVNTLQKDISKDIKVKVSPTLDTTKGKPITCISKSEVLRVDLCSVSVCVIITLWYHRYIPDTGYHLQRTKHRELEHQRDTSIRPRRRRTQHQGWHLNGDNKIWRWSV